MAMGDAEGVARELAAQLRDPQLRLAVVFADWRITAETLASELQRALAPATVVGCTAHSVLGAGPGPSAAAIGFYGDWLRAGIGIAAELPKSPIARSRDALHRAAAALGQVPAQLDPRRHVAVTLVDSSCGHEDAFCLGSAAVAPQIRFVGGSASTEIPPTHPAHVWARGEVIPDAGVVVVLESELPFEALTSSHLMPTEVKTVVTAATGRTIHELDGHPAHQRLHELVDQLGDRLAEQRPEHSFARFVDGIPYVRSITHFEGARVHLASAVETGHVLRLMRPGDLVGVTRRDLAIAADRVGGDIAALLAFSCLGRHWEAAARGLEADLAAIYAQYPTTGFQSFGEQTGVLLVNHTLTGLAIGAA